MAWHYEIEMRDPAPRPGALQLRRRQRRWRDSGIPCGQTKQSAMLSMDPDIFLDGTQLRLVRWRGGVRHIGPVFTVGTKKVLTRKTDDYGWRRIG